MASFDGQAFDERGDGATKFPSHAAKYVGRMHRFPGGNRVVVQLAPAREQTLKTTAKTDHAGYLALVAKLGETGALALGAQSGSATLIEIGSAREVLASGVFFVDLTFNVVQLVITEGVTAGFGAGPFGLVGVGS